MSASPFTLHRKVMGIIRGKASPLQVALACVAGASIGFLPGVAPAPGLFILAAAALFILNANLFVAGLAYAITEPLSFVLEPLLFEIGLIMIDGPLRPLFTAAVNTPVLALVGLDNYLAVGGLTTGLIAGVASGAGLAVALVRVRRALAALEARVSGTSTPEGGDNSDAPPAANAPQLIRHPVLRTITWLVIGKLDAAKPGGYAALLEQKRSLPVRPVGIAFLVAILATAGVSVYAARDGILTDLARAELEQINGATVDVENISLDLAAGSATITNLAAADPADLAMNTIVAEQVQIDLSATDLLTKRIAIDNIELVNARHAEPRETPGKIVEPRDADASARAGGVEIEADLAQEPGESDDEFVDRQQKLDNLLTNASEWIDRAEQLYRLADSLRGTPGVTRDASGQTTVDFATLAAAKRAEARRRGFENVTATHLAQDAPRLLIRRVHAEGVESTAAPGNSFDIEALNLTTNPALAEAPASMTLDTPSGAIRFALRGVALGAAPELELELRGVKTDELLSMLAPTARRNVPVRSGRASIELDATLPPGTLDAELVVILRNTTLPLPGAVAELVADDDADQDEAPASVTFDELPIRIRLTGPLDDPNIEINDEEFRASIRDALGESVENAVTARALDALNDAAGDKLPDGVAERLQGVLGEKEGENDGETANENELQRRGRGLIRGIIDRNKDDDDKPEEPNPGDG